MNDETRSLLMRVLLIGAVAGGAWHLLIKPLHRKADTLHAEIAAALEEIDTGEVVIGSSAQNPEFVLTTLRDHASAYQEWWAGPAPNARLYDSVRDIARSAGVRLVGVEPGRTQTRVIGEGGGQHDALLRIESSIIDATGEFGPVLAMLDSLQNDLGAVRIESFRVGPFDGAGTLHVQVTATRFIFERPFPSFQIDEETP